MNTPQPAPRPTAAKAKQLQDTTRAIPKTGKVSSSKQPCAATTPPSEWQCVKYNKLRGPAYADKKNRQPMSDYGRWHAMMDSGKITETDAKVMLLMSPNEGDFNSVQGYDNQAITVGAMQKTINASGTGELTEQLTSFKKNNPDKYKTLFQDKGWDVEEVEVEKSVGKGKKKKTVKVKEKRAMYSYTDKDGKVVKLAGNQLYDFFKSYCSASTSKEQKAQVEKAMDAMRQAGEDSDFKDQQVLDFKKRMDQATGQNPAGYAYPISDYTTSPKGRALVLDHSVNRPAYVDRDYGKALDEFYKNNPKAPKNPAEWGANREKYEADINEYYGNHREGTDMPDRYKRISKAADPVIPADTAPKVTVPPPVITPPR